MFIWRLTRNEERHKVVQHKILIFFSNFLFCYKESIYSSIHLSKYSSNCTYNLDFKCFTLKGSWND